MGSAVIEIEQVTRRFGALTAVDDVSFTVERGEIVGLLGHNGAGKTTLIRVINGLLGCDGGAVRVEGLDPVSDGARVRRMTGVLTEYPALDDYLTTRENLGVYADINGLDPTAASERIELLLHRLGLWAKRDESARGLSAGLKQRVALARGLVHDPSILLLDEPTTNMDPVAAREVRRLILEQVRERERTVLLSTHNLAEAEEMCDRVGIMRNGRLLAMGPPAQLRRTLGGARGARITVGPDGARSAAVALAGTGEVTVIDADNIEVAGTGPVPALIARLIAADVEVHRVDPLEPTLEDLYVSLHLEEAVT